MQQKTSRMSALLPTLLVEEVKKYSNTKQITQSLVLQKALESWINTKLDQDTKELAKINFDDLPNENEWLELQSKI